MYHVCILRGYNCSYCIGSGVHSVYLFNLTLHPLTPPPHSLQAMINSVSVKQLSYFKFESFVIPENAKTKVLTAIIYIYSVWVDVWVWVCGWVIVRVLEPAL